MHKSEYFRERVEHHKKRPTTEQALSPGTQAWHNLVGKVSMELDYEPSLARTFAADLLEDVNDHGGAAMIRSSLGG